MADSIIRTEYEGAKNECHADWKSASAGSAILELATTSLAFLAKECKPIDLVSRVPGKAYFTFKRGEVVARPANKALFVADANLISNHWKKWLAETIAPAEFAKLTYTVALAPCLAMEIFDRQNKKGPATFFECYIGHLFAKAVGVNPTTRAKFTVRKRELRMTMDFIFDVGKGQRKVHLPVKMSTRERVVQAWAHQRLLDAAYGVGVYRGIMVLFSETKLDARSLEVIEICVPDQWLAYQGLLAHMDRIYYFDVPARYQALTDKFPDVISIKPFGDFFTERDAVLYS